MGALHLSTQNRNCVNLVTVSMSDDTEVTDFDIEITDFQYDSHCHLAMVFLRHRLENFFLLSILLIPPALCTESQYFFMNQPL